MRFLSDKINYYFNKVTKWLHTFICNALTIMSFLMIAFYFGYIIYYSVIHFCGYRAIIGSIALFTMIHLNKSL